MMKKIIFRFILDRKDFIIGYFLNSFLIALFFHLSTGKVVEIIYPFGISFLVFMVIFLIQWSKHHRFAKNTAYHIKEPFYDLQPRTLEQKALTEAINSIHSKYLYETDEIHKENLNRSHFLSQWVHNMKTPVSIIDVILQKALTNQYNEKEFLKDLRQENNKIFEGLEQVLGIVRLGEFQNDFLPEVVDLLAELKQLINFKKNDFIYNNIFPQIICMDEKVPILTDLKWNNVLIEQVISNAIKYSCAKDESRNIYFELDHIDAFTTLSIKDQGIGISEHDIKRVFEPFYTGENGRRFKNSTGIGFYICSEISKKLGHKLDIKSELGTGTTVTITYLTKV